MQDFTREIPAPFGLGQTDDIEVDLASPWARMGAVLLNGVFGVLTYIPMLAVVMMNYDFEKSEFTKLDMQVVVYLLLALLVPVAYGIWQLIAYSRHGQTLGKKIVGIRLIKEDGGNPGFVGAVLLREVVYNIIVGVLGAIIALPFGLNSGNAAAEMSAGDAISTVFGWLASLTCVIMMFTVRDRRTLQDMLAKTVVIKLPK